MLEFVPTLLAQQSKQIAPPVQPIETAVQTQAKASPVVTPIATPEAAVLEPLIIRATPLGSSTPSPEIPQSIASTSAPQVATSPIALPPVPLQKQITPQRTDAKPQSAFTDAPKTTATKPVEKPSSSTASVSPQPSPQSAALPTPSTQPEARSSRIEIPVPKPSLRPSPQPTSRQPTSPQPAISTRQQLLEQRLAEIVARDRATKQAQQSQTQPQTQQRDALIARVYSYATQRQYDQARKLLQDSMIPTEVRSQILSNINSLESASRALGVMPAKPPIASKPVQPARSVRLKKPAIFNGVPSISNRSQQAITIQVPRAINALPIQRKSIVSHHKPVSTIASDGAYIDQIGSSTQIASSKDLQAYNRNLPKLNSRNQIVYPLPDPVSVTSRFGWRRHPVTGVRRFHAGVDLGAGQGTPIIASRSGRVTVADRMGGYGLTVVMEQSDRTQDTLYAHMSQILVRPGQQIQAGTVIGRVGSTGLSTGPHLHYESRQRTNAGWTPVDPGAQLEAARVRLVQARQLNARTPAPNLQSALPNSNRGV